MARNSTVFYAYPAFPPAVGEAVQSAIDLLKNDRQIRRARVRFRPWPDMQVSGKRLAQEILDQIDRSDVFACDLTYPNKNVSFELGYAVGRYKRVFVSIDKGIEKGRTNFRLHNFRLTGLGYSGYQNHQELAFELVSQSPWSQLDYYLLNQRYRQAFPRPELPSLLYVKPAISTSSVIGTEETLRVSKFGDGLIVDDPSENPSQSLDWYAEQMASADAVIVHLLSEEHDGHELHNVKASVVAGLARALGRPLLMLAHEPYDVPVDYGDLLKLHSTAEHCKQYVAAWVDEVGSGLPIRRSRRTNEIQPPVLDLRHVSLGDPVAENERGSLDNYFVETAPYFRALENPATILVGRKGTGKTAIMLAMLSYFDRDKRDHMTIINPVGYEIEGLVRVLGEVGESAERGFLIESLWKYLIYSEIALSVFHSINARPVYQPNAPYEDDFVGYCEANIDVIDRPFSERLDNAVRSLFGIGEISNPNQQKAKISEVLHTTLIRELRRYIGLVLGSARNLVVVIDNLDKPWKPGAHIGQLAALIGGLLEVVQDLPRDLARSDQRVDAVNAHITVMLRSDIFAFIRPLMNEPDKLPIERMVWEDPELLLRVVDERLLQNAPAGSQVAEIWHKLLPSEIEGLSARDFILSSTLPRPRDVIYLVGAAISNAMNRGRQAVLDRDFIDAKSRYSEFAFDTALAEDNPSLGKLEGVLYEFATKDKLVDIEKTKNNIRAADVSEADLEYYVDLLCDIGFLGIETNSGFRYPRDETERYRLREIARRRAGTAATQERFEINPAFYPVLQIE